MQTTTASYTIAEKPELGTPIEPDMTHVLKHRHPYHYANRPVYWYSPFDRMIVTPTGKGKLPPIDLTTLLDKIEKHTAQHTPDKKDVALYVVAGRAAKNRPGWNPEKNMHDWDWFNVGNGWKQDKLLKNRCLADYSHNDFKVKLYSTGNYFGEEKDLELMMRAWDTLEQRLETLFRAQGYKLLGDTPAQTGRELLLISLPADKEYGQLDEETSDLIYHNLRYQGRIETFPVHDRYILKDGVHILDGRWMYASCLSHLPIGPTYRDTVNEFLGMRKSSGSLFAHIPGFYNVTVTIPEDWYHIGLMKAPNYTPDGSAVYPNTPGLQFTNWTSAAEVALMLNNGWHVTINERIYWPMTDKITDLFANWRSKLVDFRMWVEQELKKQPDNKILALHKEAIRSIVLHTVGSLVQTGTLEDGFTPDEELPLSFDPYEYWEVEGGIAWQVKRPFKGQRQAFVHPEMAATVYGRARARLAEFALTLPFEDIVSLRTDSVWSASKPDDLDSKDTGRPGSFREIDHLQSSYAWPTSSADMRNKVIRYHIQKGDLVGLSHETENNQESEEE